MSAASQTATRRPVRLPARSERPAALLGLALLALVAYAAFSSATTRPPGESWLSWR